jgi:Na+(H+)/acetate symporter ActP
MLLNFAVAAVISRFGTAPPEDVQRMVQGIRVPWSAATR